MSPLGLKEREEQAAGNTDDSLNPAKKRYNESGINKKKKASDTEINDDFNGILGASGLGDSSDKSGSQDKAVLNDVSGTDDTDKIKEQEEAGDTGFAYSNTGSSISRGDKLLGKLRGTGLNFGASGSIIGLLLIGVLGVGGGTTLLSGSLLINIKELFHNDRADATRTNRIFSRATFSNMFKGEEGCKSKIPLKCKASTVSKNMLQKFKEAGIKIKGKVVDASGKETGKEVGAAVGDDADVGDGERVKMTEMEFPDGKTTAKNGKELDDIAKNNPDRLRNLERAFASKSAFYLNKFFDKVLTKFNFQKKPKAFPPPADSEDQNNDPNKQPDAGSDTTEQDKEFNRNIDPSNTDGGTGDGAHHGTDRVTEETKKGIGKMKIGKGGPIASAARALCTAYQAAYIAEASIKAYHLAQLGAFALQFLQAADQIKDGQGETNRITYLSNNLTSYEKNQLNEDGTKNPKFNLMATDAEGYKIATHGDTSGLKEFSKRFILGGNNTTLQSIHKISDGVEATADALPIGSGTPHQKVKAICRMASGGVANVAQSCAGTFSALEVIGTAAPGVGNIVAGVTSAVFCACALQELGGTAAKVANPVGAAVCYGMEKGIEKLAKYVMEKLMNSSLIQDVLKDILKDLNIDSSIRGVDAGNAIAAGVGLMLSTTATGYGLRPASSKDDNKEISDYLVYTQPMEDQYIALAKDDARDNPFDPENEYSIVGSIVRTLAPSNYSAATTSPFGLLSTLAGIYPASLQALTKPQSANADYNQPTTAAYGNAGRFDHCDDESLSDLGATGDTYCSIVAVSAKADLENAQEIIDNPSNNNMDKLIDWMTNEQQDTYCEKNLLVETGETDCGDKSKMASINENGVPNQGSQYQKYLDYCTNRTSYWGTQTESYAEGSDRDQDWYSGKACMYDVDKGINSPQGKMVHNFRMWTNYCLQIGTMDGWLNCYEEGASTTDAGNVTTSECASNGDPKAIYTCALKYDNYRYVWGGGHDGNAQEWIAKFKSGAIPEWEPILDCSGLVRMAFVEAMGIEDQAYVAPDGYNSSKYWDKIPLEQAQQGDIVTSSGHVAIVEANDPAAKSFKIFHASTSDGAKEDNIKHGTQSYGGTIAAYRAKKVTSV